jgi:nitroimidazol reductase NimA-like FMN-containing flavoprotein (pyridoxamine 5'-phosphate oxidase superfamily)
MPDDEADLGSPSGSASPDPRMSAWRVLEPLNEAECMDLLANGGLGRLVYSSRYGPTALPTVYRIDGESMVLGTWDPALFDEDLRTGIAHAEYEVAVEVDQIDLEAREGWVVLVRGAAHHLDTEAERAPVISPDLEPWIEGVPAHLIRVTPTSTWGNRILPA